MTGESKAWASLRREYLRQVEKALSSVRHPRARDVLDDVGAHLDRRLAELTPEQRSDEALRVIIADMGPPTDYATLLEPEGATCHAGAPGRSMWWGVLAGVVVIVVAVVVIVAMRGMWRAPDRIAAEELAAEAWSMWRQRKLSQAEALFLKAVETDPTHADAWNGLGWSQFNQGKATTAATSFEKCLNIEPEHAAALNGLGWIAKGEGRIDDAIGHWQRAVEALPAATAALRGLATTYMERQQYDEAVAIYEKWLRVEPNNARVKADLERAKKHLPIAGLDDLPQLLAELSDPEAPRFVALNRIIQIGTPAVPALIEEMGTSFNWQIPKALGAIGDKRAVKPLIEKLEKSDFSPMREVVVEALGRITGQDFGAAAEQWRAWWERAGQNVDGGGLSENAHMAVPGAAPVYIVTFRPTGQFRPQTARELLEAFNKGHPRGVRTHHYRTQVKDNALVGRICVDTEAGKDAVVKMLQRSAELTPVEAVSATPEVLEELKKSKQLSLPSARAPDSAPIYIVTFRPTGQFHPQTARELLQAFNRKHPRGVRTHHYRTQIKDNALVGYICVDTEAGKDAVVKMLEGSTELELAEVVRATPQMLEENENRRQVSLPSARVSSAALRQTSRRVREPTSPNRTVRRTGTWPPGDCFIYGYVLRRARLSRVDHAKVCLSSDKFGSWVVEVEGNGSVNFQGIPAGTYRLYTTDTLGYQDTYHNPRNVDDERPTFELNEGDRIKPGMEIKPIRPYRRITGRVLDERGEVLAECDGLTVSAWVQRPQGSWEGHYRVLSRSNVQEDGSYVLAELDGRPVHVQVRDGRPPVQEKPFPPRFHPGTFSRDEATLVTFGDAAVVEHVDVAMQRGGGAVLEGVVTGEDSGGPVPHALVTLFHHDMFFDLFYTYTDERGRYRLEGLGAGTFIVHVDAVHNGYVKTRRIAVVESSTGQERLDVLLRRGAHISGTLVDEEGRPYQVGRGSGSASRKRGGFVARASNFRYGSKHAPQHIRNGATVFYEEGEGDAQGTIMVFPSETTFLLPAVAPGEVAITFRPRGPGERVVKILHQGRDILKTGLTVEPGQDVTGVTIVICSPSGAPSSGE